MAYFSDRCENHGKGVCAYHFPNTPSALQCDKHGYAFFLEGPRSEGLPPAFYIHEKTGKRYYRKVDYQYIFPITVISTYTFTPV